jgi:hypothetical protein
LTVIIFYISISPLTNQKVGKEESSYVYLHIQFNYNNYNVDKRFVSMYKGIFIYICASKTLYISRYIHVCLSLSIYIYIHIYTHIYLYMYINTYVYIYRNIASTARTTKTPLDMNQAHMSERSNPSEKNSSRKCHPP